jgi:hypothetical protein
MRAVHRVVASLVTLAMVAAGPLAVPRTCSECPPGCPMHARDAGARKDGAARQPGCHRAAEPLPPDTVCLRSACGHDAALESGAAVPALPPREAARFVPAAGVRLAAAPARARSLDAPEPPTRPPRPALT